MWQIIKTIIVSEITLRVVRFLWEKISGLIKRL